MKKLLLGLVIVSIAMPAFAQTRVRGYVRQNGTYVAPHYRSSPNSSTYDNWSTRGNTNPYTGQAGTQSPYTQSRTRSYTPSYTPPCYYNCPK